MNYAAHIYPPRFSKSRQPLEHNTIQIEGPDFHDPQACPLIRLGDGAG
jgi:hypothetical protein